MSVTTRIADPSLDGEDEYIWRTASSDDEEFVVLQQRGWSLGTLGEDGTYWLFLNRDTKYSPCCPQEDRHWEYWWITSTSRYFDAQKLQEDGWQLANAYDARSDLYWYRKPATSSA